MSGKRLGIEWRKEMTKKLDKGQKIDEINTKLFAMQWLIAEMNSRGIPHRLYSLGAGVRRVVSSADKCPCCRKKIVGKIEKNITPCSCPMGRGLCEFYNSDEESCQYGKIRKP